tara:strand:+ start:2497 stop:2688 length:192 start_codon:yes stop_codon:yes gene_type:complete
MGYYATISHITNRKENMFYITYYAKKHGKFITRKGQYDKPDGTKGKSFVIKTRHTLFSILGFR